MPLIIPLMFMAIPVVVAGIWIAIWAVQRRLTRAARVVPDGWVRAPGTVTDQVAGIQRMGRSLDPEYTYLRQPIVTYRAASGVETTFRSPIRATAMPRPGAAVVVVHNPEDPTQARIAPESIPAITRHLATITGVALLIIGLPMLLLFEALGVYLLTLR